MIASICAALVLGAPVPRTASVYSERFDGRKTASGKVYRHREVSFASNDWPLGTVVEVRHGSRVVRAKIIDRMATRFTRRRIDLSWGAWAKLTSGAKPGLRKVTVKVIR